MRLGMMQPYFFPYLGYYALIAATDQWVVFDTAQYIRRGWVNRNRILSTGRDGWKYIRLPTQRADRNTPINRIQIDGLQNWQQQLFRDLDFYQRQKAPWFEETNCLLQAAAAFETTDLSEWLVHSLQQTCIHLGMQPTINVYSRMSLEMPNVNHPGQWALEVARAMNADTYINPPGGRELFNPDQFQQAGIDLQFLTHRLPEYSQRIPEYIAGLSIIDVLMWNGKERTRQMLDEYDLSL